MPAPKLLRILAELEDRLERIAVKDGFYSDCGQRIFSDLVEPPDGQLPCITIIVGERTVNATKNDRAACNLPVTVIAYAELGNDNALDRGAELLADIQTAVELEDHTLGRLLIFETGLTFVSDEIIFPELAVNAVGARVTYNAPHIRRKGDAESI